MEKSTPMKGTTSTIWSAIKFRNDVLRLHWMFLSEITPIYCVLSLLKRLSLKPAFKVSYMSNSTLSSWRKLGDLCAALL